MAGLKLSMVVFMVAMATISMQFKPTVAQTRHVVGDALGWTIPPGGPTAYTTWAAGQKFAVGDTLFFNFTTGIHNVAEVTQAAYGPCTTTNPISLNTTGPATLTLTTSGTHYYLCAVGGHCQAGQKLTINVSAATPTPTPSPTPTPRSPPRSAPVSPPTTPRTPAPSPSTTTPPPASSPSPSPTATSPPSTPPSAPSPGGSTPPSPTGSTTPPPAGTTPPPPPPNSGASSFTVMVPFTFLAIVLAFFY